MIALAMRGAALLVGLVSVLVTGCAAAISPSFDDAELSMRVKTELLNDPELGPEAITVSVTGGVVRLGGRVATRDRIDRAERVTRNVDGVRDVRLSLEIRSDEPQGREQPGRLPSLASQTSDAPIRLLGVGVSGTFSLKNSRNLDAGARLGPLLRLRPRQGLGPTVGFSWTSGVIERGPSGHPALATLRVRPVMAGLEYGVTRGRLAGAMSLVGGYSFNSLGIDTSQVGIQRAVSVENSVAARAGASLWYELSPRIGLNLFGGYLITRPEVSFATDQTIDRLQIKADSVLLSIGVAYWIF